MTVSSFWGDAPTVCDNALLRWPPSPDGGIPPAGGIAPGLLHRRRLISGHRLISGQWQEWHGERHGAGRRIRPSCVHKSEPDNCAGGELRADWLQRDRRTVPQFPVVQLPWRPSGHGEWWGPDPHCHSKPCSAVDVTPLKFQQQQIYKRLELTWCATGSLFGCLLHNCASCHSNSVKIWRCTSWFLLQKKLFQRALTQIRNSLEVLLPSIKVILFVSHTRKRLKGLNRHSHTNSKELLEN